MKLRGQENDSSYVATGLNNIGITYYRLKDYEKALRYLEGSLVLKKILDEVSFDTPMNISLCYSQLKDFEKAQNSLVESLDICRPDCADYAMIHINYARGFIFLGLNLYDKAEAEFLRSYAYSKAIGDVRMQLDNIYFLTEIYIKQNRVKKAVQYLEEGDKIVIEGVSSNLEMIKLYSRFSESYRALNNFEKASLYQVKYIRLKDSIYNEALTTSLMKIEAEFLERENQEKIAVQDEIILLKEQIINRQIILNVVSGFLGSITLLFSIFLYKSYRRKKNLNFLLELKIKERTWDLEFSRNELLTALREQDLMITAGYNGCSRNY